MQVVNTGERLLDDIADGDMKVPGGVSSVEYLKRSREVIRSGLEPEDEIDAVFAYALDIANDLGINIHEELDAFFTCFLFDAQRLGTGNVFSKRELDEAYDACDIVGTIKGSLKLFGEDPEKTEYLMPLGRATRIFYTLRDYEEDIEAGLVNIPSEGFGKHDIHIDHLPDRYSPPVRGWFKEQANTGIELLDEHKRIVSGGNFGFVGRRIVLPLAYEKGARKYLNLVLANQDARAVRKS